MRTAVIVGAKRTPIGSFMGSIQGIPAPYLGTCAAKGAISGVIEASEIQEVYMGCVLQAALG